MHSSPAIGSDGTVYVGSDDNKLYALKSTSLGLAKSPWPKFGANNQNTGRQFNSSAGLVAYYPFNGNANDESQNTNNGTVQGATLTTDRNGLDGRAYSFDGSSTYISVPHSAELNLASNFTISFWATRAGRSVDGWAGIVGKRRASTGATGDGYGLTYTPNGAWQFGTGPWDANGELTYYDPSNSQHTDLNATLWNHVVYSYDGSKERVFINGQFVQSRDSNGSPVANSQPLTIGGQNGNYLQRVHNGKIDELRIYNRSLSAGEISQLHHWESQGPTPPNITAQPVSDQNATTGGNITFSIGAAGDGNSYQWQKRDANGTWINIDGANSNSYTINSLQLSHAGTYRAAVTSASGGTLTAPRVH